MSGMVRDIDRREFEKYFNDMKMKLSNDFVFGFEACKPMYQNNPYYFPDASDRGGGLILIHNIAIVLLRLIKAIK